MIKQWIIWNLKNTHCIATYLQVCSKFFTKWYVM